jgi:glycosyltransferase involved in cell wall biosynthesis
VTGLQTEYPKLKLKIVGSGPELPFLQTLVGQKNAADMVEFLGNLPRQKALSYTQAADVFVLNSDYEGLSHVILEAQALGVPVLASNVGGNPEIVGKNGLFTFDAVEEIKNKIRSILAGDGQNSDAKELVHKNQGVEKMVHDTHSVLQSL